MRHIPSIFRYFGNMLRLKILLGFLVVFLCFTEMSAQSINLAMNYVEQGEYEKAKSVYQKLYQQNPNKQDYLLGLADVYVQLQEFENAENLLKDYLEKPGTFPNVLVELGYIYQIQKDTTKADIWYKKAIDIVKQRSVFAYSTGKAFQDRNLLDYAIQTYEIANADEPRINYSVQLARLYGEKGDEKRMFENYIKLIEENEKYIEVIQRNFNEYINEDPQNESNLILKRVLLQKLQENPDILYNQLLSWVFVQELSYDKAFTQEKAIFKRTQGQNFSRLFELGGVVTEAEKFQNALDIYDYVIKESQDRRLILKAIEYQMQVKLLQEQKPSDLEKDFLAHFKDYGYNAETLYLQLIYVEFLAFTQKEWSKALQILEETSDYNIDRFQNAQVEMLMADILVAQQQYNQALVKYSLISKKVKNTPLAQEAQYKTAMTSYYKGDFSWALTQLDVLKKATTQTIANDALEMALFIKQGQSDVDSTQQALKKMAKADLLDYQGQPEDALVALDSLIQDSDNYHILDQALFKKAKLYEQLQRFEEASSYYKQVIDGHPDSVVTDNALFALADLQVNKLNQSLEAQGILEQLIFNHQDSIFFVEARKIYRSLRGDQNLE